MWSQVVTYDIFDPAWPRLTASYPFSSGPTALAVQGGIALAGTSSGDLHLLDVTALEVGRLITGFGGSTGGYVDIALQENRALAINGSNLDIFDISDPAKISKLGTARSEGSQRVTVDAYDAYVALGDRGLDIVDIANPCAPRIIEHLPIKTYAVALHSDHAYLAAEDGFLILDVSAPTQPIVMAGPWAIRRKPSWCKAPQWLGWSVYWHT